MRQNQMNQDSMNHNQQDTPFKQNSNEEFDLERELLKYKYNDKPRDQ